MIDHLRAVEGDRGRGARARPDRRRRGRLRKVSLRASDKRVDVSRSPAPRGAAATARRPGFNTAMPWDELVGSCASSSPRSSRAPERVMPCRGRRDLLCDKPAGITSHDVVAQSAAARAWRQGRARRHARPIRDGLLLVLVGRATRVQRFLMALPKRYEVDRAVRGGVDDGRSRGRDRRRPASSPRAIWRCRRA